MRTRRQFLTDLGMGFPAVALAAMLHRDGFARADDTEAAGWKPPDGQPHFAPRAKNVIWLFMIGGTSHVESFDPKPALNRYAGKTIAETPFAEALKNKLTGNLRVLLQDQPELHVRRSLYPLQVGFHKRGESGIEISDWWPHLGSCIDDMAVIRSMWTTDNDHGAQLQFHTGRHMLEGQFPTIGSWVHYGLGSLSDDLPRFVVIGSPIADCCGGLGGHGASYLGPEHDGIQLSVDPKNPLPFASPARDVFREEQAGEFELLGRLNRLSALKYPDDPALRARIKSYELAFRMQTAVPERDATGGRSLRPLSGFTGWIRMPPAASARCVCRPGGWSSAGSGSCRSSTGPTEGPAAGMLTAACGRTTPPNVPRSTSRSPGCSPI